MKTNVSLQSYIAIYWSGINNTAFLVVSRIWNGDHFDKVVISSVSKKCKGKPSKKD